MDTGSDIHLIQEVSNSHKNSKPCRPASCEDTATAAPLDVHERTKARSFLFAALFILIISHFECIFEGLDMLKNSLLCIFCHLQGSYFNKLLLQNSSDQLQIWAVESKDLQDEKLC